MAPSRVRLEVFAQALATGKTPVEAAKAAGYLRWIACHKEFRDPYVWACNIQAEYVFDEIIDIADDVVDPHRPRSFED